MNDRDPTAGDSPRPTDKIIPLDQRTGNRIALYVGIGASAGGLEALQTFFQNVPRQSPLAFIVIQHLSPDYKSLMVELLSKKTTIPVHRAEDGMRVEPNHVYLIPPKKNLQLFHGELLLSDQDHSRGINLPIDIFLKSLAEDQAERAAAIILSGTGSDGMRGIRAVKEQGGLVMVQNEESAKFDGMPRAAASTGLADFILPPEKMPEKLISYVKHPYVVKNDPSRRLLENETGLNRIFALLRERFKVDFSLYKPSTLNRRIERRMTVNQIVDINEYAAYAQHTPAEISTLYHEMLIGVTSFFRDPQAYAALEQTWLPALLDRGDRSALRFWVAGCSTGEEAYSIAILARECMERQGSYRDLKIFATDIDRDAIAKAGAGIYPESIAADISARLLSKYFYRKDENFHIVRSIREMVVFAQHNLIKDPPFTQIDLITCRNLLIYLQPVLQRKVMDMFNFSLRADGILMLGLSETAGEMDAFFELVDSKNKIYRSRGKSNPQGHREGLLLAGLSKRGESAGKLFGAQPSHRRTDEEPTLQRFVDALSGDYIPLSIIVNEHLEVQHIVGDSSGLIRLPSGRPVNDITKMVTKELAIPISTGIQKVYRTRKAHIFSNICIQRDNASQALKMTIRPLPVKRNQESLVVVLLEEMAPPKSSESEPEANVYDLTREAEQYLRDMENELQFTRENLQATIEELETANEELQATNEELLASNEELQSTNEELQSTNEELHTVNVEYQNKIIELTELNNDVDNLLTSSQVGTLLLDENMEVRRFSSNVKILFKVLESDIGRPLTHLTHRLIDQDPVRDVREVMRTRQFIEKAVETDGGRSYLMRILPYQVGPEVYSGTVLSFTDVTELKKHRDDLADKNRMYRISQEIAKVGNWTLSIADNRLEWSDQVFEIFETDPDRFTGTYEAFLERVHPDDRQRVDRAFKRALNKNGPYNVIHRLKFDDGRIKFVNEICRTEYDDDGQPVRCIGTVQDITQVRELEDLLSASEKRYEMLFNTISSGVVVYQAVDDGNDFKILHFNDAAEQIEGVNKDALIGRRVTEAFPGVEAFGLLDVMKTVWHTGQPANFPASYYDDGTIAGWRENQVYKLYSGDIVAIYNDVTEQKAAHDALEIAEKEKSLILDNLSEAIVHLDLNRHIKWVNAAAARILNAPHDQLIGQPCSAFGCAEQPQNEACPTLRAMETQKPARRSVVDANGRSWQVQSIPLINPDNQLVGAVEIRHPLDADAASQE